MFSKVKTREREPARRLRRDEAASINEIARRTGAALSSISRWVRDIELTDDQRDALRAAAANGLVKGSTMNAMLRREARVLAQEEGRRLARTQDPEFVAGCMLYWAEGTKQRNQLQFSNADPAMARFFVDFLKKYFDLRGADIRITCQLYADHLETQEAIERHWLAVLELPPESLRKSVVNAYSKASKRKRIGNLPYGTCRIAVSRTWVIQAVFGAIQEIGGFDRPEWLD
jgi:AcrR family transcriptional regulator